MKRIQDTKRKSTVYYQFTGTNSGHSLGSHQGEQLCKQVKFSERKQRLQHGHLLAQEGFVASPGCRTQKVSPQSINNLLAQAVVTMTAPTKEVTLRASELQQEKTMTTARSLTCARGLCFPIVTSYMAENAWFIAIVPSLIGNSLERSTVITASASKKNCQSDANKVSMRVMCCIKTHNTERTWKVARSNPFTL